MKRKKITAIMAVIMMAAGLSACSQSNAGLEGKSGIVKDEDSKTESDTGVVDQTRLRMCRMRSMLTKTTSCQLMIQLR